MADKTKPQLRVFSFHPLLSMIKSQWTSVLFNLSVLPSWWRRSWLASCVLSYTVLYLPAERSNTGRWNCSLMLPNTDSAIHTFTTSRADTEAWIMCAQMCEDSQMHTLKTTLQGFPSMCYFLKLREENKLTTRFYNTGFYQYIKWYVQLFH